MNIEAFKTGRRYTPDGQRIAWTVVGVQGGTTEVAFVDVDRQIDGILTFYGIEPTDTGLLAAYDRGGYTPFRWTERDRGLYDQLATSARAL